MDEEAAGRGFDREQSHGCARVVLRVAVGRFVFGEGKFRDGEAENGGAFGPIDVELDERLKGFGEIFLVIARGDEERPRLLVAAGGSPARGFEEAAQGFR
jgi:hypothetical protein